MGRQWSRLHEQYGSHMGSSERAQEVAKILLGREGVNPDKADTQYGQTPLSWVAECGHEGMVKILLQR